MCDWGISLVGQKVHLLNLKFTCPSNISIYYVFRLYSKSNMSMKYQHKINGFRSDLLHVYVASGLTCSICMWLQVWPAPHVCGLRSDLLHMYVGSGLTCSTCMWAQVWPAPHVCGLRSDLLHIYVASGLTCSICMWAALRLFLHLSLSANRTIF